MPSCLRRDGCPAPGRSRSFQFVDATYRKFEKECNFLIFFPMGERTERGLTDSQKSFAAKGGESEIFATYREADCSSIVFSGKEKAESGVIGKLSGSWISSAAILLI